MMRQTIENKEEYYLLSSVSENTTVKYNQLYYFAIKLKTRFFTFSGRRYLEKKCLISLLCFLKPKQDPDTQNAIDTYLRTLL